MDFIGFAKSALDVVAGWLGYRTQRDAEKNAPDVKAAAIAQDEQKAEDRTRKSIAERNLDEERKELAE